MKSSLFLDKLWENIHIQGYNYCIFYFCLRSHPPLEKGNFKKRTFSICCFLNKHVTEFKRFTLEANDLRLVHGRIPRILNTYEK